jgi:hypothetical protein
MNENRQLMSRALRLFVGSQVTGLAITLFALWLNSNIWLMILGMMTMVVGFGFLTMAGTAKALDNVTKARAREQREEEEPRPHTEG